MTDPPRVLLGTAQLTTGYGVTNPRTAGPDRSESLGLLAAALHAGITTVDTAPVYGDAEEVIGLCPQRVAVHTKVRQDTSPSVSLAESRARLRAQPVEVLYLHDPDEVLRRDGEVLVDARRATGDGVTALGASVYELPQFDAGVHDPTIGFVQVPVNLLDRRFSGAALEAAAATGTRVVIRSALLQGVLATPAALLPRPVAHLSPYVERIAQVAAEAGLTTLEVAVGWVFSLAHVDGVVLGATSVEELGQLVVASELALEPGLVAALDGVELPDPGACDPRRWATA